MPGTLVYFAWQRSGVYALAPRPAQLVDGRLQAQLRLTLRDRDTGEQETRAVEFRIQGPRDVEGLRAQAVRRSAPVEADQRAETTKCVHVELGETDLPWRYTPELADGATLRPWLVLVVGEARPRDGEDEAEITVLDQSHVKLAKSVCDAHPLTESARWAHIQVELADELDLAATSPDELLAAIEASPHRALARLLSPRPLEPEREYIAAVVKAFRDDTGEDAWTGGAAVTVPLYHHFRFRTAERGDFRTLAAALDVAAPDPELGRAQVGYARVDPAAQLHIRGALAPVDAVDPPLPQDVAINAAALTTPLTDNKGRPVLAPTIYGSAWRNDPKQYAWGRELNEDPRHRGSAGIGVAGGIHDQQLIVDAVREQLGPIPEVKHRVHNLVVGLAAAGSLWERRLPTDPLRRISLFGPALARVNTSDGTVLERMTSGTRPMAPAVLSATARRVLRRGTARGDRSAPGATDPRAAIEYANTCPPPEPQQVPGLPTMERVLRHPQIPSGTLPDISGPLRAVLNANDPRGVTPEPKQPIILGGGGKTGTTIPNLDGLVRRPRSLLRDRVQLQPGVEITRTTTPASTTPTSPISTTPSRTTVDGGRTTPTIPTQPVPDVPAPDPTIAAIGHGLLKWFQSLGGPDDLDCNAVGLAAIAEGLTSAFDPTGPNPWMRERVLRDIDGLTAPELAPVEPCTAIDILGWKLLAELAPDWLLPGVSGLERDKIYAFVTNPKFVQSFMVGLNEQAVAELRWRNVPFRSGCTPIAKFWGRIDPHAGTQLDDISGISSWTNTLGHGEHQPGTATAENLVLVVKGDLFRRYPDTLVYAVPAELGADGQPAFNEQSFPSQLEPSTIAWPVFQGRLGEDLYFFGLELDVDQARRHWLVFEEPASGLRFRSDPDDEARGESDATTDGAAFAISRLSEPTRVLIRGARFLPESR